MNKTRVLIGSPIHQKPNVLREFLNSLLRLNIEQIELDFHLIDDNDDEESSRLLHNLKARASIFLFKAPALTMRTFAMIRLTIGILI